MKSQTLINILLILLAVALVPAAFYLNPGSEFGGADGQAEDIISELNPDYSPWISSLWEPPGGETESLLFSLQAALGAGVLAYGLGYFHGYRKRERSEDVSD